jgi:YVTN family beta-propeller protein
MRIAGVAGAMFLAAAAAASTPMPAPTPAASATDSATARSTFAQQRLERDGLVVEFAVETRDGGTGKLMEGDHAEVVFRLTEADTGRPVQGIYPIAWMDMAEAWKSKRAPDMSCRDRVSLYLKGIVGMRPMIDLTSYFVLVLNADSTISVIDPIVSMTGRTNLYTQIILSRPGADWAKTRDQKRVFVSMPRADQVAVIDAEEFKVLANVGAGRHPVRVALQPDGKYLWVGNDAKGSESGVTVIDADTLKQVAQIPTGAGHHEIAFSSDDRFAYVSNRGGGTISVIDIRKLEKVTDIKTGPLPLSLAFSPLSKALYVADGKDGRIAVIDPQRHEIVTWIDAKSGLGPMRFSEDGRWGFVVNTREDAVHIIDASANAVAHTVQVGKRPMQLGITRGFAYVRSLGSERVSMIQLNQLGRDTPPPVIGFAAGSKPPEAAQGDLPLADTVASAPGEAAVLVASPADATVYYYMEGMNAPMGNFRNYGHQPQAVAVVDRTVREREPGVYAARVKLPTAGSYDVAFLLDSPRLLHCFSVTAEPNPLLRRGHGKPAIEYLTNERKVDAGKPLTLRFRITRGEEGEPASGLRDLRVLYYRAPGIDRREVPAHEIGDGVYEAELQLNRAGAYYAHVQSALRAEGFDNLPFVTLQAMRVDATIHPVNARSGH